jgi:hypothetical protein
MPERRGIMKKISAGIAVGALVLGSMGVATSVAQAYDKAGYGFAASHFLNAKDLPKEFASKPGASVAIGDSRSQGSFLCSNPQLMTSFNLARSVLNANVSYTELNKNVNLFINVNQYRSNTAAEKAFAKLSKDIKKCDGSASGATTGQGGTSTPFTLVVTSGKIPAVTVTGVESVFTSQNASSPAVGTQPASLFDTYTILTLLNDVIISTEASTETALDLTSGQKKALEQIANQMVTTWAS